MNEATPETTTLDWLAALGYGVLHGPAIAPGEAAAERVRAKSRGMCWSILRKYGYPPRQAGSEAWAME